MVTTYRQRREFMRQLLEAKAEAKRIREILGPDLCRVAVLRWPSLPTIERRV